MRPAWAFFALALAILVGYSLDRGIYVDSRILNNDKETARVAQRIQDDFERERDEHVKRGDLTWLPPAEQLFGPRPNRFFQKFCGYLFPTGIHWSFVGSYSEGDIEPPCRLFERR